jgi:hypothetical protein
VTLEDFAARIERIQSQARDLTWLGALFRSPEFVEVYSQPPEFREQALQLLRAPDASEPQKIIAALSMQKLPLPELVEFSEQVLRYLESGLLSERVFERAVFPTWDWNTSLCENVADPAVQRLLALVLASPSVSSRRKQIVRDELLTGNARHQVLDLRAAGQIK